MEEEKEKMDRMDRNVKQLFEAFKTMQTNMLAIVQRVEELTVDVNALLEEAKERKRAEG